MDCKVTNCKINKNFICKNGEVLPHLEVSYSEYDNLKSKDIIIFLGGLSTSLKLHEWWLLGLNCFNLKKYRLISINSLGSIYGTTGPNSINPKTQKKYNNTFPNIEIEDQVKVFKVLLNYIGIKKVSKIVGCSLGGMQTLDFYFRYPNFAQEFISIGGIKVSNYVFLYNQVQIDMIQNSVSNGLSQKNISKQMINSRIMSRLLWSTEEDLNEKLSALKNDKCQKTPTLSLKEYYEGLLNEAIKFAQRFCPFSYLRLMNAVNKFKIKIPSIGSIKKLCQKSPGKLILVGIQGDNYTPTKDIKNLFHLFNQWKLDVSYKEFKTKKGHESWITDINSFQHLLRSYVE